MHDQFADQVELYVLGVLTPREKTAFEAHMAVCGRCTADVRAFAPVMVALASSATGAEPAAAVRGAVMSRFRGRSTARNRWLPLAASVAVAVSLGAYALQLRSRVTVLEGRLREATLRADMSGRQVADVRRAAFDAQSTLAVLAAPDLARIDLAGQAAAPRAAARAFWSRSRGLVFTASNLPAAPAGRTYQLWVITAQPRPTSAGLLKPDATGRVTSVFVTAPDLPKPVAMAVTLEPEGGVPAPTGEKYLVGVAN